MCTENKGVYTMKSFQNRPKSNSLIVLFGLLLMVNILWHAHSLDHKKLEQLVEEGFDFHAVSKFRNSCIDEAEEYANDIQDANLTYLELDCCKEIYISYCFERTCGLSDGCYFLMRILTHYSCLPMLKNFNTICRIPYSVYGLKNRAISICNIEAMLYFEYYYDDSDDDDDDDELDSDISNGTISIKKRGNQCCFDYSVCNCYDNRFKPDCMKISRGLVKGRKLDEYCKCDFTSDDEQPCYDYSKCAQTIPSDFSEYRDTRALLITVTLITCFTLTFFMTIFYMPAINKRKFLNRKKGLKPFTPEDLNKIKILKQYKKALKSADLKDKLMASISKDGSDTTDQTDDSTDSDDTEPTGQSPKMKATMTRMKRLQSIFKQPKN